MRAKGIKSSLSGRIFDCLNALFLFFLAFIMLYPFWNQLVISFNEGLDSLRGGLYFWPRKFTVSNYYYILEKSNLPRGFLISFLRVAAGTSTNLFCSGIIAYITTIHWFSGRKIVRLIFLITMYFSGGLIPTFLIFNKLGLLDTFTIYWLPSLITPYNMLLIASYMYNMPPALAESARLDGASELQIYWKIMFPVCLPVFAAVAVFVAVAHWNSWFDVIVFNASGKWDTVQVYLRKILLQAEQLAKLEMDQRAMEEYRKLTPVSIRAATTMVVTIPIVTVYPFLQKYFIGGITIGAVKQ